MAIGTGAAILGSALIGGASSMFGAKGANKAAQNNARAAAQNTAAANQAVHQSLEPSWQNFEAGRNAMTSGLRQGQDAWWNQMGSVAQNAGRGISGVAWGDPKYRGNTQFNRNTDFRGNTQIGGHWDDLRSQNFLQSPDYQFRKKEGLDAVQNSAAAGGAGLYSGNTLRGITDYASNLASGEYGNWFNRQAGLADRDYGADVANYDRANQQFGQNYDRASNQFAGNFGRDYGTFADDWGREQDRSRWLAGVGLNALGQGANLDLATETGIGQANADYYGRMGQDIQNAGQSYSNNLMGNAGYQANTPYVSPWGGINQAVQGGLQNYLWAQNAGMMGGQQQPGQNVFSAGPSWQQTYGGQGNYGHIFNPLFGGKTTGTGMN